MSRFNVLHFSDLHLRFKNDVELNDFINNINKCITEIKEPIHFITITGDLIDKGNVADFDKFYEKFIKSISDVTKCAHEKIFCVPGNHDAERDKTIYDMRQQFEDDENTGLCFDIERKDFRKLISRYEDFENFIKKIHPENYKEKTYGVDYIVIDGIGIAIIRINSSIYTHDNEDYQKLGLSRLQLDELTENYNKVKENNKIDITIALMHHPEYWLREDERGYMWEYFTSEKLPVDLIFHGHTHEGKIAGKIDLDSFTLSLVTGTTYESGQKEKKSFTSCRFALYTIDIEEKFITGRLFITNSKGKFIPDLTSYNSVNNEGVFCIPYDKVVLKRKDKVRLPLQINKYKFIDNEYVEMIDEMTEKMWDFEKACRRQLDSFNYVPKPEFEMREEAILKDWFMSIASCAKNCLFNSSDIENVRAHFRIYENGEHKHFCATIGERQITPIVWNHENNLIFHSYDKKRSLVKSLNPNLFYDTKGEWVDFLTVPINEKINENEIPKYSFGISIKGNNNEILTRQLEILSFLRIESLIDSLIASFRRRYLAYSCI